MGLVSRVRIPADIPKFISNVSLPLSGLIWTYNTPSYEITNPE